MYRCLAAASSRRSNAKLSVRGRAAAADCDPGALTAAAGVLTNVFHDFPACKHILAVGVVACEVLKPNRAVTICLATCPAAEASKVTELKPLRDVSKQG